MKEVATEEKNGVVASDPPKPNEEEHPPVNLEAKVVLGCAVCKKAATGKFCSTCGGKLTQCCLSCFFAEPKGKFCSGCGSKLY